MKYWIFIVLVLILGSCSEYDQTEERDDFPCLEDSEFRKLIKETRRVEMDEIDTLKVKVIMGAGRLLINGKTKNLFAGSFAYNYEEFSPRVKYYKKDNWGIVKVIPKQINEHSEHEDIKNIWNLRFNEDIPIKMDLKFGAGLGEINLGKLDMYYGVLKLGAGKVDINLDENDVLVKLIVKMGVGDVTIDLSNIKVTDCSVSVEGGIGKFTLLVPETVNSDIYIDRGISKVTANNFKKNGDHYYNHINDTDESIRVKINTGLGHIEIVKKSESEDQNSEEL